MSSITRLPGPSRPPNTSQQDFEREVAARFGLVPNFFRSTPDYPLVIRELWLCRTAIPLVRGSILNSAMETVYFEAARLVKLSETRGLITLAPIGPVALIKEALHRPRW